MKHKINKYLNNKFWEKAKKETIKSFRIKK